MRRSDSVAPSDRRQLVIFGYTMAVAFGVLSVLRVRSAGFDRLAVLLIAGTASYVVTALFAPRVIAPVYRFWMKFAEVLGWINTRILLIVIYYLVVTPIGLVLRLIGRSPLAIEKGATTFWRKATPHSYGDRHFEKQF